MFSWNDPVNKLRLVSPSAEGALLSLGIKTIRDLVYHYPRQWQDLSDVLPISSALPGESLNVRAAIKKLSEHRTKWRRMHLTEATLEDKTGTITAVWFNQPFLKRVLKPGKEYYFTGKVQNYESKGRLQLQNPAFELVKEETIHTAGIVPVYPLTEGITQKQIRYWMSQALQDVPALPDHLPAPLLERNRLPALSAALRNIHFPKNSADLELAKKRLTFDELFVFQLALLSFKSNLKNLPAPVIPFEVETIKSFVTSLPFTLTPSQRLAAWEILQDIQKPNPMNRLLEGEVGSGKTVVAGLAMFQTARRGWQSVLLAPTEILAWQHYQTIKNLLAHADIPIALLTRGHKASSLSVVARNEMTKQSQEEIAARSSSARKDSLLSDIADGKTKVIVGTHALLQENVRFRKIGLLIVDEQHRFGVKQRGTLLRAEDRELVPHLLSMTATPIPRTLALTLYGDLDISMLRELPKGRKKIITRLVAPEKRAVAYDFIAKKLKEGRQMYVVTPLISPHLSSPTGGEELKEGVKAATAEAEKLKNIFPSFRVGLLHGRLKAAEKQTVMNDFRDGKLDILVSTTVIEVGVDVPNACIMLIENAERFGLSQLHQLRGRVGRGEHQSYCLLFAEAATEYTLERLQAVVNSTDGFALAEKDLELRGPGEVIGTKQSGYLPLRIATLSDRQTAKLAKKEAETLLKSSPELGEYPLLKEKADAVAKDAHLE